jgi:ketosteroid isomerase-like protein
MSQENVEIVRTHLIALNERDVDGYLEGCTEDIELWSLLSALEGPYVGADGIRRFFSDVKDAAPDHEKTLVRLEAVGADRVLSVDRWTASGRSSQVAADEGFIIGTVYEFRGPKIRRIRVFAELQKALEAVGLSE